MGLFDIAGPLFRWLDSFLASFTPPVFRVGIIAAVCSLASMLLFKTLSPQHAIRRLKKKSMEARNALTSYDGDFTGVGKLALRSISLSLQHIGLTIGPAVLAAIPMLSAFVWMNATYGYRPPQPGSFITVNVIPVDEPVWWQGASRFGRIHEGRWSVEWPFHNDTTALVDRLGNTVCKLPLKSPVHGIAKKNWWNVFMANPSGYIPVQSSVTEVGFGLEKAELIAFGPGWIRSWELIFVAVALVSSLGLKFLFRIE